MSKALGSIPSTTYTGHAGAHPELSTCEVEEEGSGVEGHPGLYSNVSISLRSVFRKKGGLREGGKEERGEPWGGESPELSASYSYLTPTCPSCLVTSLLPQPVSSQAEDKLLLQQATTLAPPEPIPMGLPDPGTQVRGRAAALSSHPTLQAGVSSPAAADSGACSALVSLLTPHINTTS